MPAAPPRSAPGLRLLFVGHFGMRKGAWYLLQAMARLKHLPGLTLTIIGKQTVGSAYVAPVASMVQRLSHTPREQMPAVYHGADALVLPTLFEGSAMSTYEALASGLPVITTPNAGSIVRDGVDGFIVADARRRDARRAHRAAVRRHTPSRRDVASRRALGRCSFRGSAINMAALTSRTQSRRAHPRHRR